MYFCIEAVNEVIHKYGRPEIFNTNQCSQFTSLEFTKLLKAHDIKISMDGKGCWLENVFVGRLWRSIKYVEVYLHAYASVTAAKQGLERYIAKYNRDRPQSSLDRLMPDEFYFKYMPATPKAA